MKTQPEPVTEAQGVTFSEGDEQERFQEFMDELSRLVEFETGSLFLYDEESKTLKEIARKGDGLDFISSVRFPLGAGLSAWVAQRGRLIYLPDIHRGSRHGENPVRSFLSMPIEINSKIFGALNLGHGTPNAFREEQLKRIEGWSKETIRKIINRKYLKFS